MRGAVRHAAEMEFGGGVEAFAVEAVEERGGGGAIEAAIVKTEPYAGHVEPECAFLCLGANFPRNKALNNASRSFGSQAEIRSRGRTISYECCREYLDGPIGKVG
jgi:hypothetical protein